MKARTFKDLVHKKLKDESFRVHYVEEQCINQIAAFVFNMRSKAGLTQSELARLAHTTQPVIARLESGDDSRMPSLGLLNRIAQALDGHLSINFESNQKAA